MYLNLLLKYTWDATYIFREYFMNKFTINI